MPRIFSPKEQNYTKSMPGNYWTKIRPTAAFVRRKGWKRYAARGKRQKALKPVTTDIAETLIPKKAETGQNMNHTLLDYVYLY